MADYKLTKFGVCRLRDGAQIPESFDNMDWREYLSWVAKGNTPEPALTPEEIAAEKAEKKAEEDRVRAKEADMDDALPDWATVAARIDKGTNELEKATTIAALKVILKDLIVVTRQIARVVYWLARDRAD